MPRRSIRPVMFVTFAILGTCVQTAASEDMAGTRWERAWNTAQEKASFVPSKLTRELAVKEMDERPGETVEERADRAFSAALEIERSLRLGYTYQETRARLRQTRRVEIATGSENGKRMAAKLAKAERKNSVSKKMKALAAKNGSGKNSGKKKSGK